MNQPIVNIPFKIDDNAFRGRKNMKDVPTIDISKATINA